MNRRFVHLIGIIGVLTITIILVMGDDESRVYATANCSKLDNVNCTVLYPSQGCRQSCSSGPFGYECPENPGSYVAPWFWKSGDRCAKVQNGNDCKNGFGTVVKCGISQPCENCAPPLDGGDGQTCQGTGESWSDLNFIQDALGDVCKGKSG